MSFLQWAQEHGGSPVQKFDQAKGLALNWRALYSESQVGVCGGLSLIFLASAKIKLDMFGSYSASRPNYYAALFQYAQHAMELGANRAATAEFVGRAFSLQRTGAQVFVNNNNAAKWILNGAGPLVFIGLRGHAVAAHVEKPKVTFFDPNEGVVSFPDTLKFALFFPDYLAYENQQAKTVTYFR
jgi:hypothetical protein